MSRVLAMAAAALSAAGALRAQPAAPRATIVRDLRLDANTQDFSTVRGVFIGPHGQIAVVLPQDLKVAVFDSSGTRLFMSGGRGSGPGEFQTLTTGGWLADSLWIVDSRSRRTTFISPQGKLIRTTPFPLSLRMADSRGVTRDIAAFTPMAFAADGSLLGFGYTRARDVSERETLAEPSVLSLDAAGRPRAIARVPFSDTRWSLQVDGFGESVPFSFAPAAVASQTGNRVAVLTAGGTPTGDAWFTVEVINNTADTAFIRTFAFPGARIPKHAIDSALAEFVNPATRPREGPANLGERFQALAKERMPTVYPPVESIVVGLDRSVWIAMRATPDGTTLLVLDDRGNPVGTVLLPPRSRLRQANGKNIWVTETDNDGLASVVRYRVSGIACARLGC